MRGLVGLIGSPARSGLLAGLLGSLVLAGAPAGAQPLSLPEGQECRPSLASPAGFQDCRTRVVAERAVCRCRIVPGLDVTRRSPVEDAVSALTPAPRAGGAAAAGAAVSLH